VTKLVLELQAVIVGLGRAGGGPTQRGPRLKPAQEQFFFPWHPRGYSVCPNVLPSRLFTMLTDGAARTGQSLPVSARAGRGEASARNQTE